MAPEAEWGTFIAVSDVPPGTDVTSKARARLVGERVIEGEREDVPDAGYVP